MTGYQIMIGDSYESYKLEKLEWTKGRSKAGYVTIRNLPEKIKKLDQLKKRGFESFDKIELVPIEV